MRLLDNADGKFVFALDRREQRTLFQLLELYPLIPIGYHEISRTQDQPDDQQLLDEALTEQRTENKKLATALMENKTRLLPAEKGFLLILEAPEIEWLLQVLNDVRVGGWLALGSPEGDEATLAAVNEKTVSFLWAMDAAAGFQMALIRAQGGGGHSD